MFSTIASVGSAALVQAIQPQRPAATRNKSDNGQSGADAASVICARTIDLFERSETKAPNAMSQYAMEAWSRLVAWKMRRATRTILSSLDDRTLKDIGLERSEIERVLSDMQRRTLHWRA